MFVCLSPHSPVEPKATDHEHHGLLCECVLDLPPGELRDSVAPPYSVCMLCNYPVFIV